MKKCVIISDSFKGTLTSKNIADIFELKLNENFPKCMLEKVIISDGGEGFIDAIAKYVDGYKKDVQVSGPYFEKIKTYYYISKQNIAYIETANCIGLNLVLSNKNPSKTSSYGVGEIILDAIKNGAKKIYVGLGGSCTNDAGCGLLSALGTKFINKEMQAFIPTGESLNEIYSINNSETINIVKDVEIYALCDVENTMYGENGASYIFARQKGADDQMIKMLDDNLLYLSKIIKKFLKIDLTNVKGGGAAGAIGAGLYAFLNAKIISGIDTILKEIEFDNIIKDADCVFTGEGCFDSQSLSGKVISGVLKYTNPQKIPTIVISGSVKEDAEKYSGLSCSCSFSTNRTSDGYDIIKYKQKENYEYTVDNVLKLIKISEMFNK